MPDCAAIITGASRGIGYAIADELGAMGYKLTISARKPEGLAKAAEQLVAKGYELQHLAANLADEQALVQLVDAHRDRYGRLDVLVNNGGVGIGAGAGEQQTKFVDMQLDVNLRATVILYRECLEMLKAAGAEHGKAYVVNMSSIAGVHPQAWLSVYGATKAAIIAYTTSMNRELASSGIRSVALCPGWVDTDMTEFMRESVERHEMIQPSDIAAAVRFVLELSNSVVIPEIVFQRNTDTLF
jgi:NAD(P)-dependent dehydrogenase (short-subunit alcohol dehydrogenase family)